MIPSRIIGSVVLAGGTQPFTLDTTTGQVRVGPRPPLEQVDPAQGKLPKETHDAIEGQVRAKVRGLRELRVGAFRCTSCSRWVDLMRQRDEWSGERCIDCS
ncbi:MAG: hypothetical protein AAGA56_16945 [Myxococcota bacterium]